MISPYITEFQNCPGGEQFLKAIVLNLVTDHSPEDLHNILHAADALGNAARLVGDEGDVELARDIGKLVAMVLRREDQIAELSEQVERLTEKLVEDAGPVDLAALVEGCGTA